jgi:hypothetical protein
MGNCIYCGGNAGFFKNRHETCETNHLSGINMIVDNIRTAITKTSDFKNLETDIRNLAGQYFINSQELAHLYTKGFNDAVETVLDEGVLTTQEEVNFEEFKSYFEIDKRLIDQNNSLQKAAVLRDVKAGKIQECKTKVQGYFPFKLKNAEVFVWVFNNIHYYEQHTGITWRITPEECNQKSYQKSRSFKGFPVQVEGMKFICRGTLALTNKQIYFSSPFKNYTIPYNSITAVILMKMLLGWWSKN